MVCTCKLKRGERARKIAQLLREYGDDIPEKDIKKAISRENLPNWETLCDGKRIVAMVRREKSDWYSTTIKNLVTLPEYRGQHLGTRVVKEILKKAVKESPVIVADITYDNKPSKKI